MTSAEDLVLAVAMLLAVVVFVERRKGTFAIPVGMLLLTLAMVAVIAALVHLLVL
jgi:Na+-translocating ferredoxin:NAD+ oxidoreductase RnfD subunit